MTAESRERAYMLGLLTDRSAAKEVRLFELGGHLRDRYVALTDERVRQLRIFLRKRLRVTILGGVSGSLGMAAALVALIVLLGQHVIGVATALTAGLAMQQLSGRLSSITGGVARLIESGMFIDDYQSFLELAPTVEEAAAKRLAHRDRPRAGRLEHLRVEGVSFEYPGAPRLAVDDVSLEIERGETVALVGANGSGKTTLVKLLCGLYVPRNGRVLWNGADIDALDPDSVTSEITVLFQDYIGYHLPVHDNIAFGRVSRHHDTEAAIDAARRAGAHEFVTQLPDDYATRLGLQFEGGAELSIGQWQRLALARAFFRSGSFLILDEPTAALDPRAERDLFQQIRALTEGLSTLLISHRFSSVRSADRIYVMSSGRIVESGRHEDLMARGRLYAELFEMQAAGYAASERAEAALRRAEP
jgi:ATP-binding cassette subfamily B protein